MGMNFIHAGYEFISEENNKGDYEFCGIKKRRIITVSTLRRPPYDSEKFSF
jgi:hypothetical protein